MRGHTNNRLLAAYITTRYNSCMRRAKEARDMGWSDVAAVFSASADSLYYLASSFDLLPLLGELIE